MSSVAKCLEKYDHPYLTVDGALLRFRNGSLEAKLCRNPETGAWCLPGGFVPVDRLAEDVLKEKLLEKAGSSGFYFEQLRTYDGLDRDPRARVVSIAYLCLTSDPDDAGEWFRVDGEELVSVLRPDERLPFADLGFDHGVILRDAIVRLTNKLWYSDLPGYLFPEKFRLSDMQALYEKLEGRRYYSNFCRNMGDRVRAMGISSENRPGPRATLYSWNPDWKA